MCATQELEWHGWGWLPDRSGWFAYVREMARTWSPPSSLRLDVDHLRARIGEAAGRDARWLVHPCLSGLHEREQFPDAAHARLAVWVAVNTPPPERDQLGTLTLPVETWVWAPGGAQLAASGTHDLAAFTSASRDMSIPAVIPDPWGDSLPDCSCVGAFATSAWWTRLPLTPSAERELAAEIQSLLVTQRQFESKLPAAARWVFGVTSVIIPLIRSDAAHFQSGSIAGIPGIIFVEVTHRQLLILEAIVHESAHLYFHLAEFGRAFIKAGHNELYVSPLRPDPRPLRGIFLAYHALIYMCAFYKDWARITDDPRAREARLQLQQHRAAAAGVLTGARLNLSDAGNKFLDRCVEIASEDDCR